MARNNKKFRKHTKCDSTISKGNEMKKCFVNLCRSMKNSMVNPVNDNCSVRNNSRSLEKPMTASGKPINASIRLPDQGEHPIFSEMNSKKTNVNKLKKYEIKLRLGEITCLMNTKPITEAPINNLVQEQKMKFRKCRSPDVLRAVQHIPELKIGRTRRKAAVLANITNEEILNSPLARRRNISPVQDVYQFIPENITPEEKDASFDVVQKIIKEGKAVSVKHKRRIPTKNLKTKSTAQLLSGVRRNLLMNNKNALIEIKKRKKLKTKECDIYKQPVETESDIIFKKSHDVEFGLAGDDDDGFHVEKSQLSEEPSIQERTVASTNPAKKINVLEVITLPNRATVIPPSTRRNSSKYSCIKHLETMNIFPEDDIGLDITFASHLDFLTKLEGEEGAKDGDSSKSPNKLAQNSMILENLGEEDNQISRTVLSESTNKDNEEIGNDSIFPDVDVTPYFDSTTKRKTYSRLKSREKRTRFFILLSDDEEKPESAEKKGMFHSGDKQKYLRKSLRKSDKNLGESAQKNVHEEEGSQSARTTRNKKNLKGKENEVKNLSNSGMKRKRKGGTVRDKWEHNKTIGKRIKINQKNFKLESVAEDNKFRNKARLLRF